MPKRTGSSRRRVVVGLALTSLLAAGCQSAVQQADQRAAGAAATCRNGGTLVIANAQPPQTGRVLAQGSANLGWVRGVFESLMSVVGGDFAQPKPNLATSWDVSPDDRTAVLHLRAGVTFHTGRPFTADDVVWTVQKALEPATTSDVKSILSGWQVKKTAEHEVTITSQTPLSPVLASTLDLTPIVDRETYAGLESGSQIIGTGPYKVESYKPGADIALVRNEKYWGQSVPHLDRIEVVPITDSTAQVSALRSGRTQLSYGLTPQDALTITKGSTEFTTTDSLPGVYPLVLEATGPLANPTVRQAIAYAIDRQRINEQVFGDLGKTTGLYWADTASDYPKDLENPYTYDPQRAKQMIAAAGATGAEIPITIINIPTLQAEYSIIANNLTEIGLRPSVTALAAPDYQQRLSAGQGRNYLSLRGINGTAAFAVRTNADLRLQGAHRTFSSPEYAQLVNGVVQSDAAASPRAVHDLTQYMIDQAFIVPLVTVKGIGVQSSKVLNATTTLGGLRPVDTCLAR